VLGHYLSDIGIFFFSTGMSNAAGEHREPLDTEAATMNNTSGKLANCKNAGGVGEQPVTFFSHISVKD